MWSNRKTVFEENVSSESVYLHSASDDHDEVTMYQPSTNKLVLTKHRAK